MQQNWERNSYQKEGWILLKIPDDSFVEAFDCGNTDLNDYFQNDAKKHREELLTETYILQEASIEDIFPVALIDFCNDSIRREKIEKVIQTNQELETFIKAKRYHTYPAVKITRFGVCERFQGKNIGSFVLNMVKRLFRTDNRTGCRFLTVDAYNDQNVLKFYQKNDFQFFSRDDKNRKTRALFFDLKRLELEE
jgi:GNAT superfamily N-acetyltransferase